MKGIILAAGKGTRLYPMNQITAKTLLPIYDKPMIYYPISTMIEMGIKDLLLIVDSENKAIYQRIFGDGSQLGISLKIITQPVQRGIADAFILAEDFIGDDSVCLILGDNIFLPISFSMTKYFDPAKFTTGALIPAYRVSDPERFGVVEFDKDNNVISIEEKPEHPKSDCIVPGLYFYDNRVIDIAKQIEPSARGELEITSVNQKYLEMRELKVTPMHGVSWYDTGTPDSICSAIQVCSSVRKCDRFIGFPEIAAYESGFIGLDQFEDLIPSVNSDYTSALRSYLKAKSGLIDKED